jgi:anti-sigma B factor antagonist
LTHYQCESVSIDGQTTVRLSGEIDLAAAPVVVGEGGNALNNGTRTLVVDLADVTFMDSAGLFGLFQMQAKAHETGVAFRLQSPSTIVRRIIEVSGVEHLFDIRS